MEKAEIGRVEEGYGATRAAATKDPATFSTMLQGILSGSDVEKNKNNVHDVARRWKTLHGNKNCHIGWRACRAGAKYVITTF